MSQSQPQASHHFVLTRTADGGAMATLEGTLNPGGATRQDLYRLVLTHFEQTYPGFAHGVTTFFSLEPNQI